MFMNSYKLTITLSVSFPIYLAISDSFVNPKAFRRTTAGMSLNLLNETLNIPSLFSVTVTGIL